MTYEQAARDFINCYYKLERFHFGEETREALIQSRAEDLEKYGSTLISHHDSINGKVMRLTYDADAGLFEAKHD